MFETFLKYLGAISLTIIILIAITFIFHAIFYYKQTPRFINGWYYKIGDTCRFTTNSEEINKNQYYQTGTITY